MSCSILRLVSVVARIIASLCCRYTERIEAHETEEQVEEDSDNELEEHHNQAKQIQIKMKSLKDRKMRRNVIWNDKYAYGFRYC